MTDVYGRQEEVERESEHRSTNGGSVYEVALKELRQIGDNESYRRQVESSSIREARGQDIYRLHATLKALEASHRELAAAITQLQREMERRADETNENVAHARRDTNANVDNTRERLSSDVEAFRGDVGSRFDRTWESLAQNFESTNERTKREVFDLREEVTRVLDRRFNHVDQTFASVRADIEVLKSLQMELIKERIGRPEIVKR